MILHILSHHTGGVLGLSSWGKFKYPAERCGGEEDKIKGGGMLVPGVQQYHRRRIFTEETAKVVATSWEKELILVLAALDI